MEPFDFTTAPDWASILEKSYKPINRGFERREQAERLNDQRRIQNSKTALQLIQTFAEVVPKFKQIHNELEQAKIQKAMTYANNNKQTHETNERMFGIVRDDNRTKTIIANQAQKNDGISDRTKLDIITESEYNRNRVGFMNQTLEGQALRTPSDFSEWLAAKGYNLEVVTDEYQHQKILAEYNNDIRQRYSVLGTNLPAYRQFDTALKNLEIRETRKFIQRENAYRSKILAEESGKTLLHAFKTTSNGEEPIEVTRNKAIRNVILDRQAEMGIPIQKVSNNSDENRLDRRAIEQVLTEVLALRASETITEEEARAIENIEVTHTGQVDSKKYPGGRMPLKEFASKAFESVNWEGGLFDAAKARIESIDNNLQLERKERLQKFDALVAQGEITNAHINAFKQDWIDDGLGDPPDDFDNYITREERITKEESTILEGLKISRPGGFIHEGDLRNMSFDTRVKYQDEVAASKDLLDIPKGWHPDDMLSGLLFDRHRGAFGTVNKGEQYLIEEARARSDFFEQYREIYSKGGIPKSAAAEAAWAKVKANLEGDVYIKQTVVTKDKQSQINLNKARKDLIDDPNSINTKVLNGLESYLPALREYRDTKRGEIPEIFHQLSLGSDYTAWDLANKTLRAADGPEGDLLILPATELDVKKEPQAIQNFLNYKSSFSKTNRALVESGYSGNIVGATAPGRTAVFAERDGDIQEQSDGTLKDTNATQKTIGQVITDGTKAGVFLQHPEDIVLGLGFAGLSPDDVYSKENQVKLQQALFAWKVRLADTNNGDDDSWKKISYIDPEVLTQWQSVTKDPWNQPNTLLPFLLK